MNKLLGILLFLLFCNWILLVILIFNYYLYLTKECFKGRKQKILIALGYFIMATLMLCVVYGIGEQVLDTKLSKTIKDTIFSSTNKPGMVEEKKAVEYENYFVCDAVIYDVPEHGTEHYTAVMNRSEPLHDGEKGVVTVSFTLHKKASERLKATTSNATWNGDIVPYGLL